MEKCLQWLAKTLPFSVKIRNYANLKIQNGKTLPKMNIGILSKYGQYYRYDISMYDFIYIVQFLIPIWSWISKIMLENMTFFSFLLECGLFKSPVVVLPILTFFLK